MEGAGNLVGLQNTGTSHCPAIMKAVAAYPQKVVQYRGIQVLRGLAALLVVADHATALWSERIDPASGPPAFTRGAEGVDIFFLISGFVMAVSTHTLAQQPDAAAEFLKRRLIRILPLYWLVTLIKLVTNFADPELAIHRLPSLWNIVASIFLIPSHLPDGRIGVVIVVGWTLSLELLFYLSFALALKLRRPPLSVLVPTLGTIGLIGCFLHPGSPVLATLANPMILEFIAGVALGILSPGLSAALSPVASQIVPWIAISMSCATLFFAPLPTSQPERVLLWGGAALILVAGTALLEQRNPKFPRLLLEMGDASYSIYLLQTLLLPALAFLLVRLRFNDLRIGFVLCLLLSLTTCIIGGLISFRYLERPTTGWLRRRLAPSPRAILTISAH